jgi:phosphatidylglycerol:prolipoprotein diacylglycerol transferase
MIPRTIHIGPLAINIYGLLLGLGYAAGGGIGARVASRFQADDAGFAIRPGQFWDGLLFALLLAAIGARANYVAYRLDYYAAHPAEVFAVWEGGVVIFGTLAGLVLGLFLYSRWARVRLAGLLDLVAFGAPVAQTIGRLGNYVNQELYGWPTNLPWGIFIDVEFRLPGYEGYSRFHPLFAYEGLLNLLLFGLLIYLVRRRVFEPGNGQYWAVYLIGYGIIRFALEPLRMVSWKVGDVPIAQIVSLGMILAGLIWLWSKHRVARLT